MNVILTRVGAGLLALTALMTVFVLLAFANTDVLSQPAFWMEMTVALIALLSLGLSRLAIGERIAKAMGVAFLIIGSVLTLSIVRFFLRACARGVPRRKSAQGRSRVTLELLHLAWSLL